MRSYATAPSSIPSYEDTRQVESVTQLKGFFSHGQVFLTWKKSNDSSTFYKVYRSLSPITSGSQLAGCEYLGMTNSFSSKDHDLSRHDKSNVYLVIDSGTTPLAADDGLFVATTLLNGNYYYAVSTLVASVEDTTVIAGENSLQNPITETVEEPWPVFQQTKLIENKPVKIYSTFTSMKYETGQPLMNNAGFLVNDFAVYMNGQSAGERPLHVRFHGGGADFLYNITTALDSEINLNPEDFFPSGDNASWWGANENFDLFSGDNNLVPPTTGINYNFTYQQVAHMIDWAVYHLPVDSNRIYLEGSSLGCIGAYFYTLHFPDRIAAVKLSGSVFNLGFQNDYNPMCSLNPGKSNRVSGDLQFGTVSSNLVTNLGGRTYDVLNGGLVTGAGSLKDYPVIYSINGKNDTIVGWTEKTIYYDSVNAHHTGGYYFWDGRNHGGNTGTTWGDDLFDLFRYKRNQSFPAFANCSANQDPGDGHAGSGAPFGSINGFLDWKNEVVDDSFYWETTIFLKDLPEANGSTLAAPASCTVDVTPRRLQNFQVQEGDTLWWVVKHLGQIIQSGQRIYDGGKITIPGVMVYEDSIQLELTTDSTFLTGGADDALVSVYPNPFSESTNIRWQVMSDGKCTARIYDVQGRQVKTLMDGNLAAGIYQVPWNGNDLNNQSLFTGIYFLRIETGGNSTTKKLVMVK